MKKNFWTVTWTSKAKDIYGVEKDEVDIIALDNDTVEYNVNKHGIGRPKMRCATILPIFETKEEAEAYRGLNDDWQTVEIEVDKKLAE